jgi:hypothetical protein
MRQEKPKEFLDLASKMTIKHQMTFLLYPLLMTFWLHFTPSEARQQRRFPQEEFDKIERAALALKNHPISQEIVSLQRQIQQNLDKEEVTSIRQKYKDYMTAHKEENWVDNLETGKNAVFYFYLQALKQIPGVKLQKDYEAKPDPKPKGLLSFFGEDDSKPPITNNVEARSFKTNYSAIEFAYNGKIYRLSPTILGEDLALEKMQNPKEAEYWNTCQKSSDFLREKNCKDYFALQTVNLKVGSKEYALDANKFRVSVDSAYNPKFSPKGDVSADKDVWSSGMFSSMMSIASSFNNIQYDNGEQIEYVLTDKQREAMSKINSPLAMPGSQLDYGVTTTDH